MRILSVATIPRSENAHWYRIDGVARALSAQGHQVDLVHYLRPQSLLEHSFSPTSDENESFHSGSASSIFLSHLRRTSRTKYDLVYGNTHLGAIFGLPARAFGTPLVFDIHGLIAEEFLMKSINSDWREWKLLMRRMADSIALRLSDRIVSASKAMISYLSRSRRLSDAKILYAPNGVDLELFRPVNHGIAATMRRRLNLGSGRVLGYVGGFQPWQGVETLVRAVQSADVPDICLVVVGATHMLRKGPILYLPRVSRSELPRYYAACDMLALPRPHSLVTEVAAPTKFAEYAAAAKPVLCTDVGDPAQYIRRFHNGIVTDGDTLESLVGAIAEFASMSDSRIQSMGANSRTLAEQEFNWENIGKGLSQELTAIAG